MSFYFEVFFFLVALLVICAIFLTRQPVTYDVLRIAGTPAVSKAAESFSISYITRQNYYRRGGGVVFVVASAIFTVRSGGRIVLWGGTLDQITGLLGVLVFTGVFGLLAGALLTEAYRPRPAAGQRHPSRDIGDPRPSPGLAWLALAITGLAFVIAFIVTLVTYRPSTIIGLVPCLLAIVLAEIMQTRLDGRRRPVLTDEAITADHALRKALSTSITWLELSVALLSLGWVGLTAGVQVNWLANNWEGVVMNVVALLCMLTVAPALVCVNRGSLVSMGRRI